MISGKATTGGTIHKLMRRKIIPAAHRGVVHSAEDAAEWVRRDMRSPKTGRTYGDHQASAPGETPAVDTGALLRTLEVRKIGKHTVLLSAGTEYAVWLEFGTLRMAPRPFMRPAAKRIRRTVGGMMRDEVRKVL